MVPNLFHNLRRALIPLMSNEIYDSMHSIANNIDAIGRSKHPSKVDVDKDNNPSKKQKLMDSNSPSATLSTNCTEEFCAPCFELA